jgi:hypothetical protein
VDSQVFMAPKKVVSVLPGWSLTFDAKRSQGPLN